MRVVRAAFPHLNAWLNALPDPRLQEMCLYTAAHLWWQIIATFLSRNGSRNGFDQKRQSGEAVTLRAFPWARSQIESWWKLRGLRAGS